MTTTTKEPEQKSKVLTREEILKADKLAIEKVYVAEWNGTVCIRELTGTERDAFEAGILSMRGTKAEPKLQDARAKLLVQVICDESGKRLFSEMAEVGGLGAKKLDKLFKIASKLNGMSDEDVKELVGDLDDAQNGGSTSG